MHTEHHQWWSPSLNQDMELKVYGTNGKPILVFPSAKGRYFDFENNGMVNSIGHFIEQGLIQLFCIDSIDDQTWENKGVSYEDRGHRHNAYDAYVVEEVVPFICQKSGEQGIATTGCSMGAYHSANFFFRHPQIFDGMIALSGIYGSDYFTHGYSDDNIYYNFPLSYLPNLRDQDILEQYRQSRIFVCVGQGAWEEDMIRDTRQLQNILHEKGVPAFIDYWGHDVKHDWDWWRVQIPYFVEKLIA